jgi:hypothetical protein
MTWTNAIAVGTAAVAVGWGWKDYQFDHKPQFAMVYQEVMYDRCVRECEENQLKSCKLNGVPKEECKIDCTYCLEYIDGKKSQ